MDDWKVRQREKTLPGDSARLYLRNQAVKAVRSRCEWFSACLRKGLGMESWGDAEEGIFLHLMSLPACWLQATQAEHSQFVLKCWRTERA